MKPHPAGLATAAVITAGLLLSPARLWWTQQAQAIQAKQVVATTATRLAPPATPASAPTTPNVPNTSAPLPTETWTVGPSLPTTPVVSSAGPAAPTTSNPPVASTPTRPVVYLTFDDGPDPRHTQKILNILRAHGVHATFFMIGEEAAKNPALVRAVRADGHAVGNHTYTHPWLTNLSAAGVTAELSRTTAAIGGPVTCMRAPGGMTSPAVRGVADRLGLPIIPWSHDTNDWRRPGVAAIVTAATGGTLSTKEPRIVLMHDGGGARDQSVEALPTVIEELQAKGVDFRTIPACRG